MNYQELGALVVVTWYFFVIWDLVLGNFKVKRQQSIVVLTSAVKTNPDYCTYS